jgi:phosphatidylglycerophosphate synthase
MLKREAISPAESGTRLSGSLTGSLEKQALQWLCQRMPAGITSDHLTGLGLFGGLLSFVAYVLSNLHPAWSFLASLGLVVNWFGDSLDGTLARHRKAERPRYGYYLDHVTDALVMALIAIGAGLSPFAGLLSALSILAAYLFLAILTLAEDRVTGVFRLSYNRIGPTEIRIGIILANLCCYFLPLALIEWHGQILTPYDIAMYVAAFLLTIAGLLQAVKIIRHLATIEPPRQ